jgi:hypothetical protein
MNAKNIVETLKSRKGQHVFVAWKRALKTRKDTSAIVEKQTTAFVRAGINYANLASVREGIESGERGEVQPLPAWCEWEQAPFILRHKTNGTQYVRLYPSTFANLAPSVRYFVNGNETDENGAKLYCLASEFREREESPACFMVKCDSITEIGE